MIEAQKLSLERSGRMILGNVNFKLEAGEFVGLIGPNGAGKTSLMRAMMRFDEHATGQCNLWNMKPRKRAQHVGWLAQERQVAWDMNVTEIIALGRTPWRQGFAALNTQDQKAIADAINELGLKGFTERRFQGLSGGERARVLLARLLAQDTPFLMADEPIAALDPEHQIHVMEIIASLAKAGRGCLISIHDLGLAARFCSRLVLMNQGEIVAEGESAKVLSDEHLRRVFHIEAYRAEAQGPIIQPIRRLED